MDSPRKQLQDELIEALEEICEELGLVIGVPSDVAGGVIIGTEEFVATVAYAFNENDFDMLSYNESEFKLTETADEVRKKRNNEDPGYH